MHRRAEWRDDELVERDAEERPLMLDHADHLIRNAAEPELATERIESGEKELGHFIADDDDGRAELDLLLRKRTPAAQIVLLDREVITFDGVRVDLTRSREGRRRQEIVLTLQRRAGTVRQHGDDRVDILLIKARPLLPFTPLVARGVVPEPGEAPERKGVGAENSADEVVLDVSAHPLDDRDDGDEEHDADRHAGEGEEALELLHPDLREGESDGF